MRASTMSTSRSYATLLALFLGVLSSLSFCWIVPNEQRDYITPRADDTVHQILADIEESGNQDGSNGNTYVEQDKEAFVDTSGPGRKVVSSSGFQGCVGLVISTNQGILLGHYGVDNVAEAKSKFKPLFDDNRDKLNGAVPYMYVEGSVPDHENYANPGSIANWIDFLKELTGSDQRNDIMYVEPVNFFGDDLETAVFDGQEYSFDDVSENIKYGAILLSTEGGSTPVDLKFVTIDMQKDALTGPPPQ